MFLATQGAVSSACEWRGKVAYNWSLNAFSILLINSLQLQALPVPRGFAHKTIKQEEFDKPEVCSKKERMVKCMCGPAVTNNRILIATIHR